MCLIVWSFLLFAPGSVLAQDTCGGIEGRATSVEGWVVAKVTIRVLNKATKQTLTVETDASGNYTRCLPVGTYDVLASSLGEKKINQS